MSFREVPQFSLVSGVFLCLFFVGFCLFYFFVIATKVTSKKSFPSKLSSRTWMQWATSYWLLGRTPLLPCRFGARFKRVEVLRRSVSTSWNLCMTTRLTAQVHHWCKAPMSVFFFFFMATSLLPICFPSTCCSHLQQLLCWEIRTHRAPLFSKNSRCQRTSPNNPCLGELLYFDNWPSRVGP